MRWMPGEEAKAGEDLIRSSDMAKAERMTRVVILALVGVCRVNTAGLELGVMGGGQGRIFRVAVP